MTKPDRPRRTGPEVRAAGGIVSRARGDGTVELLLVHRPRYDDWSFPKGKAEPDESDEDCARREVLEETGVPVELEDALAPVRYRDRQDRPKVVRYWRMRPVAVPERFLPNHEVDEIRWCTPAEAMRLLSYAHDRDLVTALRAS